MPYNRNYLSHFCVAGINYRKSDVKVRGKFSLTSEQCDLLLQEVLNKKMPGAFVLSTCNRTEVYGICSSPQDLVELLCQHTQGRIKDFLEQGYTMQGIDAVDHLYKVAAGLDSQIIGDHEILSQLKLATKFSKERGCINNFLEKLINFALQSSKKIKTETRLSSGTVSVSYAAIEIIKEKIINLSGKKLLLFGTGKFGNNVASNLRTYLPDVHLSICNRTDAKALDLSKKHDVNFIAHADLKNAANESDIILVSTSSETYTIHPEFFALNKSRLILDLSVPQNVDPSVKHVPNTLLMDVDEISLILNQTIDRRRAEIPKAKKIISETIEETISWYNMQQHSPLLKQIKLHLSELQYPGNEPVDKQDKIQKTVSTLAVQLRKENNKGCQYIHAMNDYLHMN
ncbi:MAG: glutamyl-tRNA reductase [Ginsengibacter sp.]